MKNDKFYVTTPIYYVNDRPHLGHLYTTIFADALVKHKRLLGKKTFFLTGTDEHGKKIEDAAKATGKTPQELVDSIAMTFKDLFRISGISYDHFIRTTDSQHVSAVNEFYRRIKKNGDIYKGVYKGMYCVGCESYKTDIDLEDGICPIHKKKVEYVEEESYFFRLSKYQHDLLGFYENHPDFISPESRISEIINRVKEGLYDISISRTSVNWGTRIPDDEKHTFWVWFDALPNYLSGLGYPNSENFKFFWPADIHIVGKDIQWHHVVLWPALLMSAGLSLPKKIFSHGWLQIRGEKMSKSTGVSADAFDLINKYRSDTIRYFLISRTSFGGDCDFSETDLIQIHNSHLADRLGNLANRIVSLNVKYSDGRIPEPDGEIELKGDVEKIVISSKKLLDGLEFSKALERILEAVDLCNKYINDREPWVLFKEKKFTELNNLIYSLNEILRIIGIYLYPYIPETSKKILSIFNETLPTSYEDARWGKLLSKTKLTKKQAILFKRLLPQTR